MQRQLPSLLMHVFIHAKSGSKFPSLFNWRPNQALQQMNEQRTYVFLHPQRDPVAISIYTQLFPKKGSKRHLIRKELAWLWTLEFVGVLHVLFTHVKIQNWQELINIHNWQTENVRHDFLLGTDLKTNAAPNWPYGPCRPGVHQIKTSMIFCPNRISARFFSPICRALDPGLAYKYHAFLQ